MIVPFPIAGNTNVSVIHGRQVRTIAGLASFVFLSFLVSFLDARQVSATADQPAEVQRVGSTLNDAPACRPTAPGDQCRRLPWRPARRPNTIPRWWSAWPVASAAMKRPDCPVRRQGLYSRSSARSRASFLPARAFIRCSMCFARHLGVDLRRHAARISPRRPLDG